MFHSDAKQDEFAAKMLQFKRNGFFLDIGSCGSINSNNSFFFDSELDWQGICVEINGFYKDSYNSRKNTELILADATTLDYREILSSRSFPSVIDYLSLDVDQLSINVLERLPLDSYKFGVITIEHDFYIYGDQFRSRQRDILNSNGYLLIGDNVFVEQPGCKDNSPFEDWWVHPSAFPQDKKFPSFIENLPSRIVSSL